MNQVELQKACKAWDKQHRYLFSRADFAKLFPAENAKSISESLNRFVKKGLLQRVCRSVYMNPDAHSVDPHTLERIVTKLRPGSYNYISLESALSEYGAISQIPLDRLTVMTTGRSGLIETAFGVIEFTHTKRSIPDILENSIKIEGRQLRVASKQTAWRDLKRVGRNIHLVDLNEVDHG